jgi:adenylylsulfate kinase
LKKAITDTLYAILFALLLKPENFDPDITIWMNTISEGRFEDTNQMFEEPKEVNFHITEMNDTNHHNIAMEILKNV